MRTDPRNIQESVLLLLPQTAIRITVNIQPFWKINIVVVNNTKPGLWEWALMTTLCHTFSLFSPAWFSIDPMNERNENNKKQNTPWGRSYLGENYQSLLSVLNVFNTILKKKKIMVIFQRAKVRFISDYLVYISISAIFKFNVKYVLCFLRKQY